jgi:hypothetical protein
MKKSIPLQPAPDFSSLVPPDLSPNAPSPTSSGMALDNLSPEEDSAIPDEGKATVDYKVHHRSSSTDISKEGDKKSSHHVRMHIHNFEPHPPEEKPAKKKLLSSTDAGKAVQDDFVPDGTP